MKANITNVTKERSSGFSKATWVIIASVAGIAFGGFVSQWLNQGAEASTSKAAAVEEKAEPQARDVAKPARNSGANKLVQGVANKLGDIEARVERLEQPAVQPAQAMQEMPSAESYHQRHAETIRQHRAEPMDPEWGPRSTDLVKADLDGLAEFAGVQLGDVECRSESCRATVRWESMDSATANYQRLVVTPIRTNCGRTILLPEAAQADGTVEATLVFDCAEWKATGSEPLPEELLPELPAVRAAD